MEFEYYLHQITRYLAFLFPVLIAACGVVAVVKLPGAAARILCGIGFGLLFFQPFLYSMARLTDPGFYYEFIPGAVFTLVGLAGWALVFIGLLVVRKPALQAAARPTPAAAGAPPAPYAPPPFAVPTERPGWGLAGTWIALSTLTWIFGFVALALVLDAGSRISDREAVPILISFGLDLLLMIPATILYLVWLYKAWAAVPEQYRSATPGAAVGFLFIPFYNYYWVFRALPGLSASIRRAREAVDPGRTGSAGFGIGVTAAVILIIPYVNMIAWPFVLIWVILANGAKNRMLRSLGG